MHEQRLGNMRAGAFVFGRRHWRWLLMAVALSVGAIVVFNVMVTGNVFTFLRRLSHPYVTAAVLLVPTLWSLEALRLQTIVRASGTRLQYRLTWQVSLVCTFIAAITPLAAGGPPAYIYFLTRLGLAAERAAAVVTARLLLNLMFFAILAPPLFYFYRAGLGLGPLLGWLILAAAAGLSGLILGFLFLLYRTNLFEWLFQVLAVRLSPPGSAKAQTKTAAWQRHVAGFRESLRTLVEAGWRSNLLLALLTVVYWLGFFSLAILLIRSLGLPVSYGAAMVRQVLYYFIVSYVPLPGASGVAEFGLAVLFATMVPKSLLPGFVASWRFLTYHVNILLGGLLFWLLFRRQALRNSPGH